MKNLAVIRTMLVIGITMSAMSVHAQTYRQVPTLPTEGSGSYPPGQPNNASPPKTSETNHASAASGCLKGGAVGAMGGHYMHHHAIVGAMVGCAVGVHEKHAEEKARQNTNPR